MDNTIKKNEERYMLALSELRQREEKIHAGGGQKAIDKQHQRQKLTARERIRYLIDQDSRFIEIGIFAGEGMSAEHGGCPAGGAVAGIGVVSGRQCIIVANDQTVKAGAWFPITAKKHLRLQEMSMENGLPILYLVDSAGVFLPMQDEIFADKEHFGRVFRNNAKMSAMGITQLAAVMGPCVAGGAYLPVMSDETLMVRGNGSIFLAGPYLVKAAIGEDTAVVMLTHVNYHTGAMHDMDAITRAAHEKGALMLWDLAHSAGAVPVDLAGCDVDLAVGCGYKFLNGGPGAPAFLYVAPRLQDALRYPLTGWLGHAAPFAFETGDRPGQGIARTLVGTPPVLSLAALEVGIDIALQAPMEQVRAKSVRQTTIFAELLEQVGAGLGFQLASPRDAARRGSQVCLAHGQAYAIIQALIGRGVIGDFRAPDILRFGITPLYTRYVDLFDAAESLRAVMAGGEWQAPEHQTRRAVT